MKTYARIEKNTVMELFSTAGDISTMFHPAIVWEGCTSEVEVGWSFNAGVFSPPSSISLEAVKKIQIETIISACANSITSGFPSSALGSPHTYGSDQTDQANLAVNVLSSLYTGLPADWSTLQLCCDASGKWAYLPHTAAQIQQVGLDGKTTILSCLTKKATMQAQIEAAADVAAVQAITW